MIDIILCDLDSTVANTSQREHLAAKPPRTHEAWIEYSKACLHDKPLPGTVKALQLLANLYPLYFVSGRNIEAEAETIEWLLTHGVPFSKVRLRMSSDIQHNGDYKVAYIRYLRSIGFNPILMFEDHVGVSEMIEAEGVPTVTVNPRYTDNVGVNFNHLQRKPSFDSLVQSEVTPTPGTPRHRR